MVANNIFNVYVIPYAMLPIIIRVFLDSRTAFLTQVVTILICSICLRYPHEFILLQLTAGLVAIFSLRVITTLTAIPHRHSGNSDLCSRLLRFRTDNGKRFIEAERQHVHLFCHKRCVAALYLPAAFPGRKTLALHRTLL